MQTKIENILKNDDLKESISILIEEIKKEKEKHIQELILEIDRLNREIEHEKEDLKLKLKETFEILENLAQELDGDKKEEFIKAIEVNKLKTLEFLGILKETTEAAIIAALEKNEDIEETVKEITKNLAFETIDIKVDAAHIKDVSIAILSVAADIASVSINYSDEILSGTVQGVKTGILKSIEKFKESIEFTPLEAREIIIDNYDKIIKDLENVDDLYISCIKEVAHNSEAGIKEKLLKLAEELQSTMYKLKNAAQETIEIFKTKFSDLAKEAASTTSIFKEKAEEAKRLGIRAFMIAKAAIDGAIKGAKDAITKEKDEK